MRSGTDKHPGSNSGDSPQWRLDDILPDPADPYAWNRCTLLRKCSNCKRQTMHAYLRGDEYADYQEDAHQVVCLGGHTDAEYPPTSCTFCQPGVQAIRAMWLRHHAGQG